jgi:N-acetylglucosaminyldiphosphoundecaprenol N-acetyl-beta-D-mannosaminyltransferase
MMDRAAEHRMMSADVAAAPPEPRQIDVFGYKLNPMEKGEFLDFIGAHIVHRKRTLVTHLNLHAMAMMHENAVMTRLMARSDAVVVVDGMSVIFLSRIAGHKIGARKRVTSLDYIDDVFERCVANDWSVYYVGGKEQVLSRGIAYFKAQYPQLNIRGHPGYFDMADTSPGSRQDRLIADINSTRIDILIVGMGMPRQEEWVESIRDKVDAPVIITIGAMLEYFSGSLPMPPRWLGPLGLEWLFRLVTAPRRLAFRYLVEPFIVVSRLARDRRASGTSDTHPPKR